MTAFSDIPGSELYIFPAQSPSPNAVPVQDAAGQVPQAYAYEFSQVAATPCSGGSIKVADASVFPIAQQIAMAEVTIEPGAMRELHVSHVALLLGFSSLYRVLTRSTIVAPYPG